jgi:Uma2 family endonuclease
MVETATIERTTVDPAPSACPEPQMHGMLRPVIFEAAASDEFVASACLSLEEYLLLDYEGGLAEWVDGRVYLYMSAVNQHQRVVCLLNTVVGAVLGLFGLGELRNGPYAMVSTKGGPGREPDLLLVATANLDRLTTRYLDGRGDLVIEVVSDDSVRRDTVDKLREYEAAGVPEYWIIDPRPGQLWARFLVLIDGAYVAREPDADGVYTSAVFPALKLKVAWLFEERPPIEEALRLCLGDRLGL